MIDGLRPFPESKPSGVPWLGDVPAHWDVRRLKRCLNEPLRYGANAAAEHRNPDWPRYFRITDFTKDGRLREGTYRSLPPEAAAEYLVEAGDVLLARSGATAGKAFIVPSDIGRACHAGYLIKARVDRAIIDPKYLFYFAQSSAFAGWRNIEFIQSTIPNINAEKYSNLTLSLPPLDEQRLIVRFLDWHGAQTAKLVRAKKKIIALLNEQKQSIIHRAVTRGLDPNAKLKPSGIPWLGDVPEGWTIAHLRYLTRCLDGKRVPLNGTQRGAMQGEYPYWGANRIFDHINAWLFDAPLVLLGEDGAPFFDIGKDVAFAVKGKIWVNNHAHILRCGPRITTKFLSYALNFVDYRNFISGSTRDKLTQQAMGSIPIQVPQLSEQQSIIAYLSVATSELVATTNQIQREIALIQEFRTRLIADVVTGKLDVRAAAASLPEVTEIEPVDDLAEVDDLEEVPDDAENEEVAA